MSRREYDHIVEAHGHRFVRLKSGRLLSFWEAFRAAERAHTDLGRAMSRCFKLTDDDYDLERFEWFLDNVETHIGAVRKALEDKRGIKTKQERIALLRNTAGRTAEEAEAYRRKADQLEAQLGA